jgi:hypothetical protein
MDPDVNMDLWSLPPYSLSPRSSTTQLHRLRQLMSDYGLDGYLIVDSDCHYTFNSQNNQDRRISFITQSEVLYILPAKLSRHNVDLFW